MVEDQTGNKFGKWTVVERAENSKNRQIRWLCRCECGTERIVKIYDLKKGNSTNCGCARKVDRLGKRYGRLVVLEKGEKDKKSRDTFWKCKCDCGNYLVVAGRSLNSGNTKSCGCYHKDKIRLPKGEAVFRILLREYKRGAIDRNLSWEINEELFRQLTKGNCCYCGAAPAQTLSPSNQKRPFNGDYVHNGIDRMDSSKGYTEDNCVSCCSACNFLKGSRNKDEFIIWINQVYKHSIEGK